MESKSLIRRVGGAVLQHFPGLKRFIVYQVISPVVNGWSRHQARKAQRAAERAAALEAARLVAPDPAHAQDLRFLKLEAATYLGRIGAVLDDAPRRADVGAADQRRALLMDVRITQISMRERGIPRYTTALALALPDHLPNTDIAYLIDPKQPLPDAIEALRARGRIVNGPAEIAALPAVTHYLQGCIFELHKDVQELFPVELGHFRPRLSGIVYDVIPWLFPKEYLVTPYLERRYAYQMSLLPCMHDLFAISECARDDVVKAAYLPPARVTNIYGGIDESRWSSLDSAAPASDAGASLLQISNEAGEEFAVRQPYWLYVGGGDFRKNVKGLVRAFAQVLKALPLAPQRPALVIACNLHADQRKDVAELAVKLGMKPGEDIVVTGFVSDATLATCYRHAFATVFPSLYEGLGLPVLESYHFGVPALASGVSSLTEVTAPSCQFDPTSDDSIAQAMLHMHAEPALREESLAFGRRVMAECNWEKASGKLGGRILAI